MKARYDAVVVGSEFGGAVSACRLAQAGLDVALLERGRRYDAGAFPRDTNSLDGGWLWERGQGMFDVRPLNDVMVVQAAGYGGGSLVYANVQYRPPADLFDHGWPSGFNRPELDPYYDLVAYMLDVSPIAENQPNGLPPKTVLMERVAADLGRSGQFFRTGSAWTPTSCMSRPIADSGPAKTWAPQFSQYLPRGSKQIRPPRRVSASSSKTSRRRSIQALASPAIPPPTIMASTRLALIAFPR